jgi:hypothetical protein
LIPLMPIAEALSFCRKTQGWHYYPCAHRKCGNINRARMSKVLDLTLLALMGPKGAPTNE